MPSTDPSAPPLAAAVALAELRAAGFDFFSGVPCSYLTALIDTVIASPDIRYVGAVNEGDAVALACGAELAGRGGVALFQNSGLGNAVNPLTSLADTFRVPVLLITTWRGEPGGAPDEPQHGLMGRITPGLLELMEIPYRFFPRDPDELRAVLGEARRSMRERGRPFALVVRKGTLAAAATEAAPPAPRRARASSERPPEPPVRFDPDAVLQALQAALPADDAVVATTGFTGRALYAVGDRPGQFYMVGSMGCAASLALGVALSSPARRVVALDGDGALLMRLGVLATVGYEAPPNLVHVLLDNGVHDSTGAQRTVAPLVDFCGLARGTGYADARLVDDLDQLAGALVPGADGPRFVHVPTRPRADRRLPRPTQTPPEVAERFRGFLRGAPSAR